MRDCAPNLMWWYIYDLPANFLISRELARIRQGGISRKQSKHLQKARDARGKENIPAGPLPQPSLSPKSRALADNVRLQAEVKQMKNKQKNAARHEKQLKKKNAELKNKVDEAQKQLHKATAHGEAQFRTVLKKRTVCSRALLQ
ncbi:hypothetical protein C8F04DRAFT_1187142 [Mycena alexandri]|uniref:Uncharacterized protein n=1 Tax=Mycena alexandri TaxID=1745969 RepID=A0AAD6SLX4_9AGAR|nr:hypothetical protein C8F04DRAFT_1187142 [Mycena alexandri]